MSNSSTSPNSAIPTYSGFIYQGKIALLHCLKLISDNSREKTENYKLQIDSLDDFAILNDSSVLSLHQVKAVKAHLFSRYTEDFNKQKNKLNHCSGATAYFHVSQPITDLPTTFSTDYPNTKIYRYKHSENEEKDFCILDEVNNYIDIMIKTALTHLHAEEYKFADQYIKLNRLCLEEIIGTQVISIHNEIQNKGVPKNDAAYRKTISFSKLLEILTENIENRVNNNNEYWAYSLKSEYGEFFHKYCIENDNLTEDEYKTLNYFCCRINDLNSNELLTFSSSIVPHKSQNQHVSSISNYKNNTFDHEDLKAGFFKLLHAINNTNIIKSEDCGYFYWSVNNKKLYPTAIYRNEEDAEEVCRDIVEASIDSKEELFFECDKLINRYITSATLFTNSLDSRQMSYNIENEYENYPQDKIFNFKKTSLITFKEAKVLINE